MIDYRCVFLFQNRDPIWEEKILSLFEASFKIIKYISISLKKKQNEPCIECNEKNANAMCNVVERKNAIWLNEGETLQRQFQREQSLFNTQIHKKIFNDSSSLYGQLI